MTGTLLIRIAVWLLIVQTYMGTAYLFLWDYSARMMTADNMKSNDWFTYSEGPTVALPFSDWPMSRMIKENKTTLFLRFTFLVRDTSTAMLSSVQQEDDEACLIDGSKPPSEEGGSSATEGEGFRVALRNRGTWSSVIVNLPGIASLFLKTIIVPYSETDVDIRVNFLTNEISAQVSTRHRSIDATYLLVKANTTIPPLQRWPQLITFGADRHSLNKFSLDADWEVYSVSMKLGPISEGWNTARDYLALQKGTILYRMNDPPVRFAKTLRTKINGADPRTGGSNFQLRMAFSFTLTNKWRKWYDDLTTKPTDLDSPSLTCMVKPVSADGRTNLPYPSGLRVWIKPDSTSTDSFLIVEVADGVGVSHRLTVSWPPMLPGIKYNVEFLVFFLTSGIPDPNRLPLVRITRDVTETLDQVFLPVPRVDPNRAIMTYDLWIATFGGAAYSSVVVGGPCRGVAGTNAVVFKTDSFVVESVEFTVRNVLPSGASVLNNASFLSTAPVARVSYLTPLAGMSNSNVLGFSRTTYMRGGEQKDSPRYVQLPAGLNFTEDQIVSTQALVIAGELAVNACDVQSWGQYHESEIGVADSGDQIVPMGLLPVMYVANILTVAVECVTGRLVVKTPANQITDSRFIIGNGFRAFRVTVTLPSNSLTRGMGDSLEVTTADQGTIRTILSSPLPRTNWGPALWLGRETASKRIVFGDRGWTLRNVEMTVFDYAPCLSLVSKDMCDPYSNCAWNTKLGCRPATVIQGQDATQTPTLGTRPPSNSPTVRPTTRRPTIPGYTEAPSRMPTDATSTPTDSPTIPVTSSPTVLDPNRTPSPTMDPTTPPVEYEYEQQEYETTFVVPTSSPTLNIPPATPQPTVPVATFRPTSMAPTTSSPTPSITGSPTTAAPTTRVPTPRPSPTASPTTGSPQISPTSSPTTIMPTSPSASPSSSPVTSTPSTSPTNNAGGTLSEFNANASSTANGSAVGAAVGTTFGLIALAAVGVIAYKYRKKAPKLITAPPVAQPQQLPRSPRKPVTPKPTAEPPPLDYNLL